MLSSFWGEFILIFNANPRLITLIWTACWAVISFGLGVWAGHYLAKKRDRRKEFNAVADPLFLRLDKFLDECREDKRDMPNITRDDFRTLRPHLSTSQCNRYNAAVDAFFGALDQFSEYDGRIVPIISDPKSVIPTITDLLVFVKHR